jgi:hypothetical protein
LLGEQGRAAKAGTTSLLKMVIVGGDNVVFIAYDGAPR